MAFMQQSHFPYDAAWKEFFSGEGVMRSFLESFVSLPLREHFDLDTLTLCPTHFSTPEYVKRECDILWRLDSHAGALFINIIVEFQSSVDKTMALRAGIYNLLTELRLSASVWPLPPVMPIVIYIGTPKWTAPRGLAHVYLPAPPQYRRFLVKGDYLLIDLQRLPQKKLLGAQNECGCFFRLNRAKSIDDLKEITCDIANLLTGSKYGLYRRMIANYVKCMAWRQQWPDLAAAAPLPAEDLRMLGENIAIWREDLVQTSLEKGIRKGLRKGRKEGRKEGREEGQQEGMTTMLLAMLRKKFGSLPDALSLRIAKISDADALVALGATAMEASSLEDFVLAAQGACAK